MPNPIKRVVYRKHNGNDAYSYAIFVDGKLAHPSLTGLNLSQAKYYANEVRGQLLKKLPS